MYFVYVLGFSWYILYVSASLGIKLFPENVWKLPEDLSNWTYMLIHGGMMFGMNMIYLAYGYIITVNFLNFSNYLPADFF